MGGRITFTIVVAVAISLPAATYGADWVPGEIIIKTVETINISGGPTGEPEIDVLNEQYGVYEMTRLYDDELLLDGPVSHPRGLWDWSDWVNMVTTYEFDRYYVFKYSEPVDPPVPLWRQGIKTHHRSK